MVFCSVGEEEKKKRKKKKKKDSSVVHAPMEKAQEIAMVTEPSEENRKPPTAGCDPEPSSAQKASAKAEKKRRRSQTAEGSESYVPSKIRKTSCNESEEKESGGEKISESFLLQLLIQQQQKHYSDLKCL